jgi:excinuclease ABC subunit C
MKIRDEAHRRAISYHRGLLRSALTESQLDQIPGIGEKRKMRLLRHFKDLTSIAQASVEELTAVPGIHRSLAEAIREYLDPKVGSLDRVS